jgi:hypothetical protein
MPVYDKLLQALASLAAQISSDYRRISELERQVRDINTYQLKPAPRDAGVPGSSRALESSVLY